MRLLFLVAAVLLLAFCSESSKDFSSVRIGMTTQEVLQNAGEPTKKRDIVVANLWIYENANRTVVFRKDTVYDIITSADARIDSIERSLDNLGDKIENQAEKAGRRIDSVSRSLKNIDDDDTLRK